MTRYEEIILLKKLVERMPDLFLDGDALSYPDGDEAARCRGDLGNTDDNWITGTDLAEYLLDLQNAAPWLLAIASCFREGDARKIDTFFRDCMCPDNGEMPNDCSMCDDDTIDFCDLLRRMQEAARLMEVTE